MTLETTALIWFRQDLRITDNPALSLACTHAKVIPIYIYDENISSGMAMGAASKVYLHHALKAFNTSLAGKLNFFHGNMEEVITKIINDNKITHVYSNIAFEPKQQQVDAKIKQQCQDNKIVFQQEEPISL